jgi:transposase
MSDGSPTAAAVLGLDGFVVRAVDEIDGEVWMLIETTGNVVGCPVCGCRAIGHGRRRVRVRDLPAGGRPVVLVWAKRVWRCPDADCAKGSWTERHPAIRPKAALTERARAEVCRRVGEDAAAVAKVARDFGVGWHTAMAAVRDVGRPLVEDPGRLDDVTAIGLDETAFLKATALRGTRLVTGLVDLDSGRLLEVLDGRSAAIVEAWLGGRPPGWLARIEAVAVDPFRGYASGVTALLGDAVIVLDHFHAIRLANAAVDDVRRRTQQATTGHRGRKPDPLYRIRRLLLVGYERLTAAQETRIWAGLHAGDPDYEVAAAWVAKELLRDVYAEADLGRARRRLLAFYEWVADVDVPELTRLARTIANWETELLAFFDTGLSNGRTEGVNLMIKKIKRVGHGFRNYDNYRLRLLLHCGVAWNTPRTTRLRGRQPRLIA